MAPTFRYSTDAGATWQLGALSEASEQTTPPDQGDQTTAVAVSTVDGQPRWVVLGSSWRQPLTWTSTDGRTWDRHVVAAEEIPTTADVSAISAVPEGFVLVGTDATDRPTAWTSPDGVSWQPHRMGGHGTPASVTSKGSTVVAVGSNDDAYAVWSSNDRGSTWSAETAPPKPDDDGSFSRSLDSVTATDDGFAAVGSYYAKDWRPVVYTSVTGSGWRLLTGGDTLAAADRALGTHIAGAGRQLLVTQEYEPQHRFRLWTGRGGSWTPARTPLQTDRTLLDTGDWSVGGPARSGSAWLVAALRSTNGQLVSEIWRSTDGRTFTQVPRPDATLTTARTFPLVLLRTGEDTVVLGDSRRRAVAWSRSGAEPGTGEFGAAALVSATSTDRLSGGAVSPRDVLAYGTRSAGGSNAAVVLRPDGKDWSATRAGTFSEADNPSASSEIRQIAWLRNRCVAVGSTTTNGDLNASALIATSTDGREWVRGKAATTYAKKGGDVWNDVTDLAGDHDRTRAAYGVTSVGDRLLAVGESAEGTAKGQGSAATIWVSDDARTWTCAGCRWTGWRGGR